MGVHLQVKRRRKQLQTPFSQPASAAFSLDQLSLLLLEYAEIIPDLLAKGYFI